MNKLIILIFSTLICNSSFSQKKALTEQHYFKNDFKGIVNPVSTSGYWIDDSHYQFNSPKGKVVIDAKNGTESQAADNIKKEIVTENMPYNKEHDIYLKINGIPTQLTHDSIDEKNPSLSPDGNHVAYTKNNDLYVVAIANSQEKRLTYDGSDVILNGYASWVYMEEILGRSSNYRTFWWSPDSKHIAFFRSDDSKVPTYTLTDAMGQQGSVDVTRYPKAGNHNPDVKVGIVSLNSLNDASTIWADFNPNDDQYFGLPYWMPDGKTLLVQWMNRKQNELKIWAVNPAEGSKKVFLTETQKTWINLDDKGKRITFLNNGKGFLYLSDQSGYQHIYLYDINGQLKRDLNTGNTNVTDIISVDETKQVVYFMARKENTARKDFYCVGFNGKNMKRLTFGDFHHSNINLSPNASYFVTTYSNSNNPTQLALVDNKGKLIKVIADAKGAELDKYEIAKTEIVRVKSDDSLYLLPMKITWPTQMEPGKKYPVLISIYGGPNAGTVMDNWAINGAQQWYAKEGLIQVAMDHRASGHFGKEGVNYMYHNLGYWEMRDYIRMVNWLIDNGQADPKKICITGFSYGGYMSCYALTYGANVFTHAMAGGSVTDWSLYDSHYTERYMGTPEDNAEGYKKSSVMTYADLYKGKLQIVHGIADENVHMQNSIQLISKLQDLKKDFEFMPYSGGRHGWGGNKWLHYQNLKTQFIYKYLLEKPVPKEMMK
jgi:dipeptidyl-peptidase-4